jgi:uncharacterized protein YcfJ
MNRIAASAIALAISAAAAGGAVAGFQDYGRGYDSRYDSDNRTSRSDVATVISARPVYDRYASQGYERQECWNERTNAYDDGYYRDSNGRLYRNGSGRDSNANGTLIGALIGGALGNQAGKGDGRKAATIGGAVIGGMVGNNIDRNHDAYEYRDNSGTVRRCRTVVDYDNGNDQVEGYEVTYRYAGQTYHAVTSYRPGRTMRVVVDVRPQDTGVAYRR